MTASGPPPVSQLVVQDLTRAAIFLVVTINPGTTNRAAVRSFCSGLPALVRAVGFRDIEGNLSCVMGIGSDAWDRLFGEPRPAELHPFREFKSGPRHAVATSGDLMFHLRAKRMDLCFELATQIMTRLGGAVSPVDEVHGFRYFDDRDLIGFVDGTENPTGQAAIDAANVGAEDAVFAGGTYVIVQKYLHDLAGWNALSTETQERIIGRTKLSDIELDDAVKPAYAHNALAKLVVDGQEIKIIRERAYPDAIAQALSKLRLEGVNGPYSVLLGADAYTALSETSDHGYPVLQHIKSLVDGEIIWTPGINGAFVLTTRGGDFALHIGEDVSIGYLSHDDKTVRLYLQETFTFLLLTTEAAVALTANDSKAKP